MYKQGKDEKYMQNFSWNI